jgi:Holliday junction DNA helicase RuvA
MDTQKRQLKNKMIYSLSGQIIKKATDFVVIECGGVGYECKCSVSTAAGCPHIGESTRLLTYLHITENDIALFGFLSEQEKNCFTMLLSVSGVGPKVALSVLSGMSPERFALAVAAEDPGAFKGIKGVGTKTAARIVLDLKDKLKKESEGLPVISAADLKARTKGGTMSDAVSALTVLGFTPAEAAAAVGKLDPAASLEDMIKSALKELSKGK